MKEKRKYKSIIGILILIVIIFTINIIYQLSLDNPELYGPYKVERVVDGDTIVVRIDNSKVKVRLIGINTPESVHSDETKNTKEGVEASDYLKSIITEKVYLEYDVEPVDQYGRTMAYVYLDDGKTMIERVMLAEGLATTMTVQPNSKYADELYNIQVEARESGTGFWGTGFFN